MVSLAKAKCCPDPCDCDCWCATPEEICWTIDSPPEAAVCSEEPSLESTLADLLSSKMVNTNPDFPTCRWWSIKCVEDPIVPELKQGYRMVLSQSGCTMEFTVSYSCGMDDCCAADDESSWSTVAQYQHSVSPSEGPQSACDGDELTFTRVFEASDPCGDCPNAAPDIEWPSTLTLVAESGCGDEIDRGDDCSPHEYDSCCDLSTEPHDTIFYAHITSSCGPLNGLTIPLTWAFSNIWRNIAYGFDGGTGDGTLCGKDCYITLTYQCFTDPGTGAATFTLNVNLECDLDGDKGGPFEGCELSGVATEAPVSSVCDPLSVLFTRTLKSGGTGGFCGDCTGCAMTITITR